MRRSLVCLVLLAACAGPTTGASDTMAPPPVSRTTSAVGATSSTASQATTSSPATIPATSSPTTMPAADGPSGSGCTPGDGTTLPEGEWFGFVTATSATGIEFDLACWFTGQAAVDAAAEDGEESPPPNDYYVRNVSNQVRSLTVSSGAPVVWYPSAEPNSETESTFEEWAAAATARGFVFGVWVEVIDGEVQRIREQWVP